MPNYRKVDILSTKLEANKEEVNRLHELNYLINQTLSHEIKRGRAIEQEYLKELKGEQE